MTHRRQSQKLVRASAGPLVLSRFTRKSKWGCISFSRRVSHVTRAQGSKGTRGWRWGEGVPQMMGAIPTCPNLLREGTALCIMDTDWWPFLFSQRKLQKFQTYTLASKLGITASDVLKTHQKKKKFIFNIYIYIYKWAKYNLNTNLKTK